MSMIFILIQIEFDIDINNDELLKTIWIHKKRLGKKKKNSWSSRIVRYVMRSNTKPKLKTRKQTVFGVKFIIKVHN